MMRYSLPKLTIDKIYIGLLLIIFGGIVLQGPISVGLGSLWPAHSLLIKSWKEILIIACFLLLIPIMYRTRQFKLLKDPLLILIGIYALLHILLLPLHRQGITASVAGLIIDLRYVVYFALVYCAIKLYPGYRPLFLKVGLIGALVVVVFALLQVTVLPADILKYLGYNTHTIVPYLTVDQNTQYIRINSTLRGPNPVGAYSLIVITLLIALFMKQSQSRSSRARLLYSILAVGAIVALWFSYSRSALIAAVAAIIFVVVVAGYAKLSRNAWIGASTLVIAVIAISLLAGGNKFISNVAFHDNPNGGSVTKSDQGHISSLSSGLTQLIHQPTGSGIGSTGSASLYSSSPDIIENQYLFTAHETGWLGLILFLIIFLYILRELWRRRQDWLALGVLASGIGLALVGLLLPVWADDTVSLIWWGLAAIALGTRRG